MEKMPRWADVVLIPLINLTIAFSLSALVILAIGENPIAVVKMMIQGALGSSYGWGYTLYYATNFLFTGLAVAVAFQASLFNIGGEGQAAMGGLGVALVALYIPFPHWTVALIFAMAGGAMFGALWALIPAYLQAKRGSHIVITTIMFNFIAASLLNYLLVNVLRPQGSMDPSSARFPETTHLPTFHDMLAPFGINFSKAAPVNISLLIGLAMAVAVYFLLWRTRLGYEIRAFGKNQSASVYAGISITGITIIAMMISGGIAGMMAINNTMGESERLIMNSVEGAGFIGIAVALMAALLFGFLYQGGGEVSLWTKIPRELIIVVQALVIMFTGSLDNMVRMPIERAFINAAKKRKAS